MAIQYSLSYDTDGNPSLVKNTVQGSSPVIKSNFNIGAYKPTRTVSTDYTSTGTEEPFNEESQLKILKTYIAENDSNPNTFSGDSRNRDRLTAMDRDKMSRLTQFTGKQSAIDYEKYAKRSAIAGDVKNASNLLGLGISNPFNTILGTGARIVEDYSDRQITKLMNNSYASQEYQDYMKDLDRQYNEYQDYDVYNDYRGGPNYRDEKGYLDVKSGTVFDAEDEETNFTSTSSFQGSPAYSGGDDSSSQEDTSPGSTGPGGSDEMGSF